MNNKPFSRSERVSQQVLKTINDILTREMDLRKYGFITFSSVKMTADLKHATLYYSVLNPTKKIEIIIETAEMKIVVVKPLNKNFKLVNPSILLGDKINQLSSLLPHDVKGKIKSKKNKFLTLQVIKN